MKRFLIFVLVLSMALSLGFTARATSAEYADVIRVGVNSDQTTLDPHDNRSNTIVLSQIFNGLVKRDMENVLVPDLAESWDISEDELTWTFYLKKGILFQNGVEFTARDVKASFDRTTNPEKTYVTTGAMNFIKETRIVDDYTVQVITEKPVGPLLQTLAGNLGGRIMCADVLEQYDGDEDFGFTPESVIGTGPYQLKEWNRGENIIFEAFDDCFMGKPKTKTVVFEILTDATARGIAIETGQIDICFRLVASDAGRLRDANDMQVLCLESQSLHQVVFNLSRPLMQDVKVRQAIVLATDTATLVEALYSELEEEPCTAPCSKLYFGYNDMGVQPYDVERAKALLAEAGYPNGIDIKIMGSPTYNKGVEMIEVLSGQMAEAGIRAEIVVLESAAFSAAMASNNPEDKPWDMWLTGMGNMILDFNELRGYRTTAEGSDKPNGSFYSNAEFDDLVDKAAYTTDVEARAAYYKRAAEILWFEDPCALYVNYRKNVVGIRNTVENFKTNAGSESNLFEVTVRK